MKHLLCAVIIVTIAYALDLLMRPVLPTTYKPGQVCLLGTMHATVLMTSRSLTGNELYKVHVHTNAMWVGKDALKECK